ncbi:hypothetical protein R1flu_008792 [Riccia fluitans]|uniref:Uncharacterized protein n=1 Tax=Riccia fluitans TaxID=41844 RepID=A0ABD1XEJ5_9MARC
METWGLGGLFAVDWSGTFDNLVELVTKTKAAGPKFEYRGKPEEWTSEVWREVYNLPKASLRGYIMRGKIQFTKLQLLKVVKGERRLSKSRVFLEQIEGNFDFVLFCQILNAIFAPIRPEHFQHNLLAFYHHAWAAITNSDAPTLDWEEVVKKTVARQIKGLGVCNEATCLGPYLAHLYTHFHEMDPKEKEASKKHKASIQTISDTELSRRMRRNQKRRFLGCFVRAKLVEVSHLTSSWILPSGATVWRGLAVRPLGFLRHFTWSFEV